jgi:hypothetical protein
MVETASGFYGDEYNEAIRELLGAKISVTSLPGSRHAGPFSAINGSDQAHNSLVDGRAADLWAAGGREDTESLHRDVPPFFRSPGFIKR